MSKSFTEPFDSPPPDGPLQSFPMYLKSKLKGSVGVHESYFWRDLYERMNSSSIIPSTPITIQNNTSQAITPSGREINNLRLLIKEQAHRIQLLEEQIYEERLKHDVDMQNMLEKQRREIHSLIDNNAVYQSPIRSNFSTSNSHQYYDNANTSLNNNMNYASYTEKGIKGSVGTEERIRAFTGNYGEHPDSNCMQEGFHQYNNNDEQRQYRSVHHDNSLSLSSNSKNVKSHSHSHEFEPFHSTLEESDLRHSQRSSNNGSAPIRQNEIDEATSRHEERDNALENHSRSQPRRYAANSLPVSNNIGDRYSKEKNRGSYSENRNMSNASDQINQSPNISRNSSNDSQSLSSNRKQSQSHSRQLEHSSAENIKSIQNDNNGINVSTVQWSDTKNYDKDEAGMRIRTSNNKANKESYISVTSTPIGNEQSVQKEKGIANTYSSSTPTTALEEDGDFLDYLEKFQQEMRKFKSNISIK